ncbi:MAG: hypothetical protein J6I73_04095 [Treponema sp.]|nr:hypothetical protein [Treponema sp.]
MSNETALHWAEEKEVVRSVAPIKLLVSLVAHVPKCVVNMLIFPVGFFYLIFSKRARLECSRYQKQFIEYTNGEQFKRPKLLRQIISFSLCILEKIEGWSRKIQFEDITFYDDVEQLIAHLDSGKGALLIGSHLGNTELLRSLAAFKKTGVERDVPVTVIMETGATQKFNSTIREICPDVNMNVVSAADIGLETIYLLQERLAEGGMVVIAGDRTSAHSSNRTLVNMFLGKEAAFPYGTFLLAYLLKTPVYFFFALRKKDVSLSSKYNMYVHKSPIEFETCSRGEKENCIKKLCSEFVHLLEKYCLLYPFQWYNFFNFWAMPENQSGSV